MNCNNCGHITETWCIKCMPFDMCEDCQNDFESQDLEEQLEDLFL